MGCGASVDGTAPDANTPGKAPQPQAGTGGGDKSDAKKDAYKAGGVSKTGADSSAVGGGAGASGGVGSHKGSVAVRVTVAGANNSDAAAQNGHDVSGKQASATVNSAAGGATAGSLNGTGAGGSVRVSPGGGPATAPGVNGSNAVPQTAKILQINTTPATGVAASAGAGGAGFTAPPSQLSVRSELPSHNGTFHSGTGNERDLLFGDGGDDEDYELSVGGGALGRAPTVRSGGGGLPGSGGVQSAPGTSGGGPQTTTAGAGGGARGRDRPRPVHNPAQDHLYLEFIQLVAARATLYPRHVYACSGELPMSVPGSSAPTSRRGTGSMSVLASARSSGRGLPMQPGGGMVSNAAAHAHAQLMSHPAGAMGVGFHSFTPKRVVLVPPLPPVGGFPQPAPGAPGGAQQAPGAGLTPQQANLVHQLQQQQLEHRQPSHGQLSQHHHHNNSSTPPPPLQHTSSAPLPGAGGQHPHSSISVPSEASSSGRRSGPQQAGVAATTAGEHSNDGNGNGNGNGNTLTVAGEGHLHLSMSPLMAQGGQSAGASGAQTRAGSTAVSPAPAAHLTLDNAAAQPLVAAAGAQHASPMHSTGPMGPPPPIPLVGVQTPMAASVNSSIVTGLNSGSSASSHPFLGLNSGVNSHTGSAMASLAASPMASGHSADARSAGPSPQPGADMAIATPVGGAHGASVLMSGGAVASPAGVQLSTMVSTRGSTGSTGSARTPPPGSLLSPGMQSSPLHTQQPPPLVPPPISPAAGSVPNSAPSTPAFAFGGLNHPLQVPVPQPYTPTAGVSTRQQYFDHPTVQLHALNERLIALLAQIRTGWVVRTDALFFMQSVVACFDQTCRSDWVLLSDIELIAAAAHIEAPRIKTLLDTWQRQQAAAAAGAAAAAAANAGAGGNATGAPGTSNINSHNSARTSVHGRGPVTVLSGIGTGGQNTVLGGVGTGGMHQPQASARYYGAEFSNDDHDAMIGGAAGAGVPLAQRELQSQFARYVYSLAVALCWSFQIAQDTLALVDAAPHVLDNSNPLWAGVSERLVHLWQGAPIRLRAVSDLSVVQTLLTWSVNSPYIGDDKDSEWARAFVQALQISSMPTVYIRCPSALPRLLDTIRHLAGHTVHSVSFRTLFGDAHAVEVIVDVLNNSLIDPFQCRDVTMIAVAVQALYSMVQLAQGNRNAARALHLNAAGLIVDHVRNAAGIVTGCYGGGVRGAADAGSPGAGGFGPVHSVGDVTDRTRHYPLGSDADRARIAMMIEGFRAMHVLCTESQGPHAVFEVSLNHTIHVVIQSLLRLAGARTLLLQPLHNQSLPHAAMTALIAQVVHPRFLDVWSVAAPLLGALIKSPEVEGQWLKQVTIAISECHGLPGPDGIPGLLLQPALNQLQRWKPLRIEPPQPEPSPHVRQIQQRDALIGIIGDYAAPQNIRVALDPNGCLLSPTGGPHAGQLCRRLHATSRDVQIALTTGSGPLAGLGRSQWPLQVCAPNILDLLSVVQVVQAHQPPAPPPGSANGGQSTSTSPAAAAGGQQNLLPPVPPTLADSVPLCHVMANIMKTSDGRAQLMSRQDGARSLLQPFIEALCAPGQQHTDRNRFLALCELLTNVLTDARYHVWFKRQFGGRHGQLTVERFAHLARKHPLSGEQKPDVVDRFLTAVKWLQSVKG